MAGCCPWRLVECLETVYRTVYKEKGNRLDPLLEKGALIESLSEIFSALLYNIRPTTATGHSCIEPF